MRLSVEMFDEIVEALRSDSQPDRDKRLEPRVGMAGEATIITLRTNGTRKSARVRVRDVSRTGIGLYYSSRFAKDQRLVIQLQSHTGTQIWLICVAAHCRRVEPDRFVVGVRVKQVLRDEEIARIELQLGLPAEQAVMDDLHAAEIARIAKAVLA